MTNRDLFLEAGGTEYHLVPCLNDHPDWIEAMASLMAREARGWAGADEGAHHPSRSVAAPSIT